MMQTTSAKPPRIPPIVTTTDQHIITTATDRLPITTATDTPTHVSPEDPEDPLPVDQISLSSKSAVPAKFSKCVAMIQNLFSITTLDVVGNVVELQPPTLTDDFLEALSTSSSKK